MRRQRLGYSERMKPSAKVMVFEQLLVADAEERSTQRGKHGELIVGPLDGHQRGAQRLDLVAVVERLPADEQVLDATRFERLDVRAGDVLAVADKAPEQDADVARLQRNAEPRLPPFGHRPAALMDEPVDVRTHRVWQRALYLSRGHESVTVRLGHRQRDEGRLLGIVVARLLEGHVVRLPPLDVAVHHRLEGGVHRMLDVRHAAKTLPQLHADRSSVGQQVTHAGVNVDIRAAKQVDRLLRVADDEQLAGNGDDMLPASLTGIGRGQQQEELGLERIGILELVHENPREPGLKMPPHHPIVVDQITRAQQQVEEVERAFARLELRVALHASPQLGVQQRCKVGVGTDLEVVQRLAHRVARREDLRSRGAFTVGRSAAFARALEVAVAPQLDELRLERVEIGHLVTPQIATEAPDRLGIDIQVVAGVRGSVRQIRKRMHERDQLRNRGGAIEGRARPRAGEVAPFDQLEAGAAQPLDGTVLVDVAWEERTARPPQRAADAFRWILELFLEPGVERFLEETLRLPLGEHAEERIHARLYGAFAEQVGAKAVNRADVRLFEVLYRILQAARDRRVRRLPTLLFELLTKPQLQLAGGLLCKGHRDDRSHAGPALTQDADDAIDELGRLSGAGRGLDDERLVHGIANEAARFLVSTREKDGHGRLLISRRSLSGSCGLRATRRATSDPHTGPKSHRSHASGAGEAARNPRSIARSITWRISSPAARVVSVSGMACSAKLPADVQ